MQKLTNRDLRRRIATLNSPHDLRPLLGSEPVGRFPWASGVPHTPQRPSIPDPRQKGEEKANLTKTHFRICPESAVFKCFVFGNVLTENWRRVATSQFYQWPWLPSSQNHARLDRDGVQLCNPETRLKANLLNLGHLCFVRITPNIGRTISSA